MVPSYWFARILCILLFRYLYRCLSASNPDLCRRPRLHLHCSSSLFPYFIAVLTGLNLVVNIFLFCFGYGHECVDQFLLHFFFFFLLKLSSLAVPTFMLYGYYRTYYGTYLLEK